MELKINLKSKKDEEVRTERVKKAVQKKSSKYVPTWVECWEGYINPKTGKEKKGIYQTKLTDKDKEKLDKVKMYVEEGKISLDDIPDLSKFSKSFALSLYPKVVEIEREALLNKLVEETPDNYHLIQTEEEWEQLEEELKYEDTIAVDTETTGLDFEKDHIVGFSMSLPNADKHYYCPIRHITGEKQLPAEYVIPRLKVILENPKYKQIYHNVKFDYQMFYKEGIKLANIYMDTMEAMKLLNENEMSYRLKDLATKYGKHFGFNEKSSRYDELFGNGGFEGVELKYARYYAVKDTHLTLNLSKWIDSYFTKQPKLGKVYYEIENPMTMITLEMEMTGVITDVEYAENYTKEARKDLDKMLEQLNKDFPIENINSPSQLSAYLYDTLGLTDISKKKSVDKETLQNLSSEYAPLELLLEYRKLEKLLNTFYEKLPQMVRSDGRLHPRYNQRGARTGRLSSNDPNFQQITPKARPMFVAGEGKLFLLGDFSGQEVRMLAHLSNDEIMKNTYDSGLDLYSMLASKVYKQPYENCLDGSKYRKLAKKILLGNNYGMSIPSLARELKCSVEEAEETMKEFQSQFPHIAEYKQKLQDFLDQNGYLETFVGSKRRFIGHVQLARNYKIMEAKIKKCCGGELPENLWKDKRIPYNLKQEFWKYAKDYNLHSRQCLNSVIQGSSAYQTKLVMIALDKWCKENGYNIVAQYHDEVMLSVDEGITEEKIKEFENIMVKTVPLSLESKTDMVICKRWGCEVDIPTFLKHGLNCFDKRGFVNREVVENG